VKTGEERVDLLIFAYGDQHIIPIDHKQKSYLPSRLHF